MISRVAVAAGAAKLQRRAIKGTPSYDSLPVRRGAVQFSIARSVFNYCCAPRQLAEHGMVVAHCIFDRL